MHHPSSSFNDSIFSLEYDHMQAGCSHMSHSPIAGQALLHWPANRKYFYSNLNKKDICTFLE